MKKLFLLIETSSDICSVGIANETDMLAEKTSSQDFSHTAHLTLFITECIDKLGITLKDIAAVGINNGPGSYTGLRIGASVAKAICFANEIPLITIDSLTALSYGLSPESNKNILSLINARNNNCYYNLFSHEHKILFSASFGKIQDIIVQHNINGIDYNIACNDEEIKQELSKYELRSEVIIQGANHLLKPFMYKYFESSYENIKYFSVMYLNNPNITKSKKLL